MSLQNQLSNPHQHMSHDIERGFGVLCFDPCGDYADWLVSTLPTLNFKRIVYFNLADNERYIALNPCDPSGQFVEEDFKAWRKFLYSLISPAPEAVRQCLDYSMETLFYSAREEAVLTLANLSKFLQNNDYRRFVVGGQPHLQAGLPSAREFSLSGLWLSKNMEPVFNSNFWCGTLAVESERQLPPLHDKIVIVRGTPERTKGVAWEIWKFSFFQYLNRSLLNAQKLEAPFRIYDFSDQTHYQGKLKKITSVGQGKIKIAKRYSRMKYARHQRYALAELEVVLWKKNKPFFDRLSFSTQI